MTPEGKIKNAICQFLSFQPDVFFWPQDSVGIFDEKLGIFRKKSSLYHKNGVPDIMICLFVAGLGIMVGFEVKTPKNKQSEDQKEFAHGMIQKCGLYYLVRSVDQAIHALEHARVVCRQRIKYARDEVLQEH